ncbi:gephyrin-like molybdotransferase Glp [Paenibacillus physcomitrellae]|uniref:Molybdopterin molybdenumtransferase n=1 Tax=Paenibacillus physcomitrellae TaxID=1619311 RepID=A0ABQ1FRN0_9BACL|nr:gephyrin-like molybdotransferase Glp [Paenibacillus physcomitrellae]GGA25306.1 molybdopterin molybdenumtransferase MoeA [Paenibacillus physcomitrellae]
MNKDFMQHAKFKRNIVQPDQAQQLIMPYVKLLETEHVALTEARGRFLAEPVLAPHPYPHFRRSGMDGYALRSEDTKGAATDKPVTLEVIDEIPAGSLPGVPLRPGTAARIMTGAKVPDEADAVVMLEMTEKLEQEGQTLFTLKREIEAGTNLTPIGRELQAQDLLLEAGRMISAGETSVLATFGYHQVLVRRRPRVAICSTGSELLRVEEPLQDGRIRNSNTYTLACQVQDAGGEPYILDSIADDLELAKQRVMKALEEYDIVITSGGVSVGDYDIMADLVQEGSVTMLFNKVAMRPGSVTTAAVYGDKLLFALSGNPGACFVGFELFARPAIRGMLGASDPYLPRLEAVLGEDYTKINNFTRFVRGSLEYKEGRVYVHPAKLDESGVMITIKDSDVLIVVPPTSTGFTAGQQVTAILLPKGI